MGYLSKVLLGTAIGVAAVAAVPFTGGGSLLGGASIIVSLAGAGAVAGAAGVVGAAGGAALQNFEDKKNEKKVKEAKMHSFMDGMNEGKACTVEQIKKFADFCLATTALSFYIARCDGSIDEDEMLELQFDLDVIKKNKDIPDAIKSELQKISLNENITFLDVKSYLNEVGIETLEELKNDIDELIVANGEITKEEEQSKNEFQAYLEDRKVSEGIYD